MEREYLKILKNMVRIRMVEQYIAKRYPEQQMKCPTHLCVGQEAAPAVFGVFAEPKDTFVGTYRSHGHYLAKGGDITSLFAELLGKPSGCSKGFGGSMHLIDTKRHVIGTSAIVASGIPIAAGIALNFKYQKRPSVSVAFFGDAALEEGVTYETANFATLHKLPLLMVCENNQLAVTTPLKKRQASLTLYNRFKNIGLKGVRVKENNFEGLIKATRDAFQYVRRGHGPMLLEYCTSRMSVHVGYDIQGPADLWWKDPFAQGATICPLARFTSKLLKEKRITMQKIHLLRKQTQKEIDSAYKQADSSQAYGKIDLNSYVYASPLASRLPSSGRNAKHANRAFTSKTSSKLINPF